MALFATLRTSVTLRQLALGTFALLGIACRAEAQDDHPITWSLRPVKGAVVQGEKFTAKLHADIPYGWHVYSMTQPPIGPIKMEVSIPEKEPFLISGPVVFPDPIVALDPNFDNGLTETYLDSATFVVPLLAKVAGKQKLKVLVHYHTCNEHYCLPPMDEFVVLDVSVAPGREVTAADLANAPPAPKRDSLITTPPPNKVGPPTLINSGGLGGTEGASKSLLGFLGFAALMGALSLLTPCVFPMVPITVSYFTQRGAVSRAAATKQAAIYGGGIMATFTILGMAIALLVGAGGINRFAANPWVNLLITSIFVGFALNLFGLYQLQMPSSLLTKLDAASQSGGRDTIGTLLMGLTFTLTSFTCTTPLVGTLLVMAAQGGRLYPLFGLLVFSAVFALPFFLLALMPSAVQRLPRSGSWLGLVKPLLGCIELAMAFKFLSNADLIFQWGIFTRNVVLVCWVVLSLTTIALVFDLVPRMRGRNAAPLTIGRGALAAAALVVCVFLGKGLSGERMGEFESFLPPREGGIVSGSTNVPGELSWLVNDYAAGLKEAKEKGKAVLIDFTGYTCTNCRWMESNMFPKQAVVAELDQFVRVRLYTDGQGEPYVSQQKFESTTFKTVALPLYAIFDADGNPVRTFLGMTRKEADFINFLTEGRKSALGSTPTP